MSQVSSKVRKVFSAGKPDWREPPFRSSLVAQRLLLSCQFMQVGFMGEPFFGRTQGQIGKMRGHARQFQTIQEGFELLMAIDGMRHRPSRLEGMNSS